VSQTKSNYSSIIKATSIFGGVQVVNILITLIRGKAVALLIGTAGMGLNGLLLSSLKLVGTITSLGIGEGAVKDISKAHSANDQTHVRTTFQVFKRLIWFTAILGILVTVIFSPLLSKFAFGDTSKTSSFIWLAVTFLFGALSGGVYTLLRGTRQLKLLAQANIYGGIVGLVVALPFYYFLGLGGVVPAIIVTAFANYLVSLYFKSKISFVPIALSWHETIKLGKPIVQLGLSLTLMSILASGVAFVLIAYISKTGSLSDVGLYSAGNAIVEGYVGMVFTAMAADYFPRLASLIDDDSKWKKLVNEQAEIVLIILGIVLVLLITTTPILIRILLSKEFMASQNFIQFSVLAIPLKGLVWVLGFIILAKGNNKLFLTVEIIANLIVLGFNILFYHLYGLTGLGLSLSLSYFIVTVYMLIILNKKYHFKFSLATYKFLIFSIVSLSLCLLTIIYMIPPFSYLVQGGIILITLLFYFYELNKRINLKVAFHSFKSKFKK
jgi:O-antigen/teichoic acid export membrane protein